MFLLVYLDTLYFLEFEDLLNLCLIKSSSIDLISFTQEIPSDVFLRFSINYLRAKEKDRFKLLLTNQRRKFIGLIEITNLQYLWSDLMKNFEPKFMELASTREFQIIKWTSLDEIEAHELSFIPKMISHSWADWPDSLKKSSETFFS
jgi:hypothetical protein